MANAMATLDESGQRSASLGMFDWWHALHGIFILGGMYE